ncbi:MAG: glycerophosphodiester phosphodiesterase family protein [Anaerolineae bacterium]|nr:glycerophosphodiester phosphodiesterase family protein [Anaerolineae bacterium]
MQKLFLFSMLLLVACSAPASPTPTATLVPTPRALASPTLRAPRQPLVVAHRGGAALAPENTLGAFVNALQLGVDMVECDVHLSKDGHVIVMHDTDVARTTDGRGYIADLTLAEIKKLNAAAKFPGGYTAQTVPTLDELLDVVKGKTPIQIEIKVDAKGQRYPNIEQQVVEAVRARGMLDEVIVISFNFPTLTEIKRLEPRIATGALVRADWFSARGNDVARIVHDAIDATGADYFMPNYAPVTEALINAVHARGLKIGVWTVNNPNDMQRLAAWGVDAITTDRPDELKRVLGR